MKTLKLRITEIYDKQNKLISLVENSWGYKKNHGPVTAPPMSLYQQSQSLSYVQSVQLSSARLPTHMWYPVSDQIDLKG